MSIFSDTLETVFVIKGAEGFISKFSQMTNSAGQFAKTITQVTGAGAGGGAGAAAGGAGGGGIAGLAGSLTQLGGAAGFAAAQFALAAGVIIPALRVFAEDEQQIFRTAIVLKNLGSSLKIDDLQKYAQQLQKTVAIDDEAVVALAGTLSRFGLAGDQVKQIIPSIVDASKATGKSIEEIGQAVGLAAQSGMSRGLRPLIGALRLTHNEAQNLLIIQKALDVRFRGAGAAQRNTLEGALTATREAFNNFLSALGERFAPAAIRFLNGLTKALDFFTEHAYGIAETLKLLVDPLTFIGEHLGFLRDPRPGTKQIGNPGELASEKTLLRVATGIENLGDNLIQRVLGGSGQVASQAVTLRDVQMAFRTS